MTVTLWHNSPLEVSVFACRTCWDSFDKSDTSFYPDGEVQEVGDDDKALLYRVGNKFKHKSILEHLGYTFKIEGITRACLQELARHRTAKLSVKSSRYTLKELKSAPTITEVNMNKYIKLTGNEIVDRASLLALQNLQGAIKAGVSNDVAKYCMPEAYLTELVWTIDARNLQHFLELRTDKAALPEIRELALRIYLALPDDHKYLFKEYVKNLEEVGEDAQENS